jgi:hypothetical protein
MKTDVTVTASIDLRLTLTLREAALLHALIGSLSGSAAAELVGELEADVEYSRLFGELYAATTKTIIHTIPERG